MVSSFATVLSTTPNVRAERVDARAGAHTEVVDGDFLIGPVNGITFLTLGKNVPASLCGPFATKRAFLEAFRDKDACGGTKVQNKLDRCSIERIFEIYDVIRPLYASRVDSSAPVDFAHSDLSVANVMVDSESGEVTGLIDWETAGF